MSSKKFPQAFSRFDSAVFLQVIGQGEGGQPSVQWRDRTAYLLLFVQHWLAAIPEFDGLTHLQIG